MMTRFIRKSIIFSALLLLYFAMTALINMLIIRNSALPLPEANLLIIGDSHPEKAIDPALFNSALNLSQSSEPYPVTLWKLRRILQERQVDTVLIGFSHHNLTGYQDTKFRDADTALEMFRRMYSIASFNDLRPLQVDYPGYLKAWIRNMAIIPRRDHFNFLDTYDNSRRNDISDYKEASERHFKNKGLPVVFSVTAMKNLDAIIELCREHQVEPVLVGCPVHLRYLQEIPDYIRTRYDIEKERYRQMGVHIIDQTRLVLPDSCYLNSDHLNQSGAEIYFKILSAELRSEKFAGKDSSITKN